MIKQADMGGGFMMDKEKGITRDGKVIFTPEQLSALVLYYDLCKEIRENVFQKKMGEAWDNFFGGNNDD